MNIFDKLKERSFSVKRIRGVRLIDVHGKPTMRGLESEKIENKSIEAKSGFEFYCFRAEWLHGKADYDDPNIQYTAKGY